MWEKHQLKFQNSEANKLIVAYHITAKYCRKKSSLNKRHHNFHIFVCYDAAAFVPTFFKMLRLAQLCAENKLKPCSAT